MMSSVMVLSQSGDGSRGFLLRVLDLVFDFRRLLIRNRPLFPFRIKFVLNQPFQGYPNRSKTYLVFIR